MNRSHAERQKGVLALFVLVVIWGILPIIPRFLSFNFMLFQQVYLRMFLGFILSLIIFSKRLRLKIIFSTPVRDWILIIFRATSYYLFGVVLNTQALLLTKISNVTLIGTIPITAILGFILLKEKVTFSKVLFVSLSFLGAIVITIRNFSGFSLGSGELLAFLSSLCISLALISRKWQSDYLNDQETSTLILLISTLEIFTFSLIRNEGFPVSNWNFNAVGFLIIGGILNAGTGFFSNYGLARVDAVLSSNILMLEPVLASLFGFLIFKEVPMIREILGGLIIIFSVILMHRAQKNEISGTG